MKSTLTPFPHLMTIALLASSASAQDLWQFDFRSPSLEITTNDPIDPVWAAYSGFGTFFCSLTVDLDMAGNGGSPVEQYNNVVAATTYVIDDATGAIIDIPTPPGDWVIEVGDDFMPGGPFNCSDFLTFRISGTSVFDEISLGFADAGSCSPPSSALTSTDIPTCKPAALLGTATFKIVEGLAPFGTDTLLPLDFPTTFPSLSYTVTPLAAFSEGCFGDGGDQMGCTACPCMNESTIGSGGGCKHSASDGVFGGAGARLIPLGAPSIGKQELTFEMANGVPNSFAVLNSGPSVAPNPAGANPCVGANPGSGIQAMQFDGLRCVISGGMGPVVRHGTRPIDALGYVGINGDFPSGNPNNRWGWGGQVPSTVNHSFPNASAFVAGQTRHFQAIFRDQPEVICGREQNTTQRVSCTMTP